MYLNEQFADINDYLGVAFDAQNGFGSKVLQANFKALEEAYTAEIRNRFKLLEKVSSALSPGYAEIAREQEMQRIACPKEDDIAALFRYGVGYAV